jgi:hypothetical protein
MPFQSSRYIYLSSELHVDDLPCPFLHELYVNDETPGRSFYPNNEPCTGRYVYNNLVI